MKKDKEYFKAVEQLNELAMSNQHYIETEDYLNNYLFDHVDEACMSCAIWNHDSKCDSEYYHEHYDSSVAIETLMKRYQFDNSDDLFTYLYENCDIVANYESNQYHKCFTSTVEFGWYSLDEYWSQLNSFDDSGLFDYLRLASDEIIDSLTRDTDMSCIEFQGDRKDDDNCLVDFIQYVGAAVSITCSLKNAIEILNKKDE